MRATRVAGGVSTNRTIVALGLLAFGSAIVGMLASAATDDVGPLSRPPFTLISSLPISVIAVTMIATALVIAGRRTWWAGLAIFFVWLPFEDLVRKFASNDIRVYLVKDILLVLALVSAAPFAVGRWKRTLGDAWAPTLLVLAVAFIFAIPGALVDPRLPAIGLIVRFLFAAVLPIGAYLAEDRDRLRKAMVALAAISIVPCAIGVIQTIVGPEFLNPSVVDEALSNLIVTKGAVIRPSGPFVDAGRFASMTTVSLVLGICVLRLARSRRDTVIGAATVVVAGVAAFASGGRTALILGVAIAVFGLGGTRGETRRRRPRIFVALVVVGGLAVVSSIGGSLAGLTSDRFDFYSRTLSLSGSDSELLPRLRYYRDEASRGISAGGLTGQGTGTQTVGKQYLGDKAPEALAESGWGSVAVEWGIAGLAVWLAWTYAWCRRAIRASRLVDDTPARPILGVIAIFIVFVLVVLFTLGANTLDNYVTNTFFWFFSGIAFGSIVQAQAARDPQLASPIEVVRARPSP